MRSVIKVRTDYSQRSYITPGKIYEAKHLCSIELYELYNDEGCPLVIRVTDDRWGCAHIGGHNWEIVEDAEQ